MPQEQATSPTNGAPAKATNGAGELLPGPGRVAAAQARIRAGRSETLAALEAGKLTDSPAKAAPEANPEPAKAPEPEKPAPDETETETGAEDTDANPPVEPKVEEPADPEQSKRLAAIQRAERAKNEKLAKEREKIAGERAAVEKERAALQAERAEFDAWRKAKERAKIDPLGYLEAAGISSPEDLDYTGRLAYQRSKAPTDPAQKEAAARWQREREFETRASATEKRIADLESKLAAKDQQSAFEQHRTAYLDHAVKVIGDDAPLARSLAAKNPAKLRAGLWATAERLIEENDGDVPDVAEIVSTYEKNRRAELEELGFDVAAQTASKKNSQQADKKHPAKTLGNDLSTPRVPRPAKSDREHRAETLALLESGKLE